MKTRMKVLWAVIEINLYKHRQWAENSQGQVETQPNSFKVKKKFKSVDEVEQNPRK